MPNAEIIVATNKLEAVEVIKTQKLDLILMDVQMPLMTGIEATSKYCKLDIEATQSIANLILKELKNRPVIILITGG